MRYSPITTNFLLANYQGKQELIETKPALIEEYQNIRETFNKEISKQKSFNLVALLI